MYINGKYYTTLNKIKSLSPCKSSWVKLLKSLNKTGGDNDLIALEYIVDNLCLYDAIYALQSISNDIMFYIDFINECETSLDIILPRYLYRLNNVKSIYDICVAMVLSTNNYIPYKLNISSYNIKLNESQFRKEIKIQEKIFKKYFC